MIAPYFDWTTQMILTYDFISKKINLIAKNLFQLCLFSLIGIQLSTPSYASQTSVNETQPTAIFSNGDAINKAGRQRMLSERMVKAYIQLSVEVDMQKAESQLESAIALFEKQLEQLTSYAPTSSIMLNIDAVKKQWDKTALILKKTPTTESIPELITQGELLVHRSNQVVLDIQQYSGNQSAALVNTSGRQRMLSQRMAKYYFAHLAGQRQPITITNFENSLAEFEKGLTDLSVSNLNTQQINKALKKVKAQLHFSKAGFKGLNEGHYTPHVISRTTESMLKRMESITQQYTQLHDQSSSS